MVKNECDNDENIGNFEIFRFAVCILLYFQTGLFNK